MGTDDKQHTPPADEHENTPANDTHDIPDEQALALFTVEANQRIRKVWHDGRLWYSVTDTIALLTESANPRNYWVVLKHRLLEEGASQTVTKCKPLKMRAADGKMRTTDAADRETLFRIGQSIPSPKAEPFKQWLARTAEERLQEEEQPSKAIDRLGKMYAKKGYTDQWIGQRIKKILVRDIITSEWLGRGARTGRQIAQLTSELHAGTFAITPSQHLAVKDLPPNQNLQDSMTGMELGLNILADEAATFIHQARLTGR